MSADVREGGNKAAGKVTEMFLLLAFTGLDHKRYGSHAYRTEQPWVGRGPIRQGFGGRKQPDGNVLRPRKDRDGFDLISDRLRYGPIWYIEPDPVRKAVAYAKYRSRSRSHRAIIRVFNEGGNVTETYEQ